MKVSRLLKKLSPLLLVFSYVFFCSDDCGGITEDESTEFFDFDGTIWNLVSSKWYNGKGEEVNLNMYALVIEGDGDFSQGERQVQWYYNHTRVSDPKWWGKCYNNPLAPPSTIKIRMKTWDLKTLENGEKEEPYLIADFGFEYAYYLGQNLRVEDDGKSVVLKEDYFGGYMMFAKGRKAKKGYGYNRSN